MKRKTRARNPILSLLLNVGFPFGLVQAGVRIQPDNLTYLGHFKVPDANGSCSDTPNARALGLTYDPAGNGGAGIFFYRRAPQRRLHGRD